MDDTDRQTVTTSNKKMQPDACNDDSDTQHFCFCKEKCFSIAGGTLTQNHRNGIIFSCKIFVFASYVPSPWTMGSFIGAHFLF